MPTFHIALEGADGRIGLVPYTAPDPPQVGETITVDGGAQGIVERISTVEDVQLFHAKRTD